MATNPVVKLKRGSLANLSLYPAIDGCMYLASAAANDNIAQDAITSTDSYNIFVIGVQNGSSVEQKRLDAYRAYYAQQTGYADKAGAWFQTKNFQIKDNDGTNSGNTVAVDGSSNVTLKLPATIKAAIVGNVTGIATKANKLVNSSGNDYAVGSSTKPVYFDNGIPVVVGSELDVDISGGAGSAAKWSTARNFKIQDNDASNTGATTSVDGSSTSDYILKLPATIKATLTGKATSAGKLVNNQGDLAVGSAKKPVYFSNGVPVVVGDEALEVTVESANMATALSSSAGNTTTPIYFESGKPKAVTGVSASLITGVLDISNIPSGALERLSIVSQTATLNTDALVVQAEINAGRVEPGDVVQVTPLGTNDPGQMYFIYDDNGTIKYREFTAGTTTHSATADIATKLASAKNFSITGAVTASAVSFDGSDNVTLSTSYAGTVPVNKGGTNKTSWTKYGIVYASDTSVLAQLGLGTSGYLLSSGGSSAAPSWKDPSTIDVGSAAKWSAARNFIAKLDSTNAVSVDGTLSSGQTRYELGVTGTLKVSNGGTGKSQWAANRLVYASATNVLDQIAAGTSGQVLQSKGTNAPEWVNTNTLEAGSLKYSLTVKMTDITGSTVQVTNGGNTQDYQFTYGDDAMTADISYDIKAEYLFNTYKITDMSTTLTAGTWYTLTTPTGMTTGSYIVQIRAKSASGSAFNEEYFTGVMSYSQAGASGAEADSDEVLLHSSGRNAAGHRVFLRTTHNGANAAKIEFQADVNLVNGTDKFDITFRRII